ncbi:MAG: glycosyl transferase [Rhodospirillaceae bacterium]|nr:glycosyl transferase [Rhodospirillaceae bacterium]|tara:strand:- start:44555 stop:45736 length:1182 start_codon:yes stop_codon:yes gene_type:complete
MDKTPPKRNTRVLFYVQHLLGIGHLKRAATLCRALESECFDVTMVSGGKDVPGVNIGNAQFVQLPAMRSKDENFSEMLNDKDEPVDEALRAARREMLLDTVAATKPDLIITELFPFGRRHLRDEIIPMIEAALALSPKSKIVSSVRDILVEPSKKERGPEMVALVQRYYDLVLVHGDPNLVPFEKTFPLANQISDRLNYTGYIVDPPPESKDDIGSNDVIVSAGGGALSEPLFDAAIKARPDTVFANHPWRLLAGPSMPLEAVQRLKAKLREGITLEPARPDFTALLQNCALSISQGGYNTVMDVLAARVRAVIAPYAGGKETEQTLRAKLLSANNLLQVVWEEELNAERLVEAINTAANHSKPSAGGIATNGAQQSASILARMMLGDARIAI